MAYYYDENGNLTKKKKQTTESKTKQSSGYFYDKYGNLVSKKKYNQQQKIGFDTFENDLNEKLAKAEELRTTIATTKNKYQRSRNGAGKEEIATAEKKYTDYLASIGYDSIDDLKETIADLKGEKTDERTWFQKGAFEDGYQFGDVLKTSHATGRDITTNLFAGATGIVESTIDAGAYLVGGIGSLFGANKFKDKMAKFIAKDIINEEKVGGVITDVVGGVSNVLTSRLVLGEDYRESYDDYSVLGEKSDSLVQSGGQLAAQIGLQAVGVPWYVTTGVTSFGASVEESLNEGAGYGEAGLSSAITAGADILTEKLFGGSGLGETGLIKIDGLTKGISNKAVKALVDWGIDVFTEGGEEVAASFITRLGNALTYEREDTWKELLTNEEAMDNYISQVGNTLFGKEAREEYLEAGIGGAILGGGSNVNNVVNSVKQGTDYRTGLTANEEKVFNKAYENAIAEAEQGGKKLTEKDKAKIYDDVMKSMQRGDISTDTIEEVLGGEDYKDYNDAVNNKKALQKEFEELGNKQSPTLAEQVRYAELKQQLGDLKADLQINGLKTKLTDGIFSQIDADSQKLKRGSYLAESYNQIIKRGQALNIDINQYKTESAKKTVKNAIDSGMFNDTNQVHDFVDFAAKLSEDKGYEIDFTTTARLNESIKNGNPYELEVSPERIDAFVSEKNKKIVVNLDANKSFTSLLGHEITDTLRAAKVFDGLKKAAFAYAKAKGEYADMLASVKRRYRSVNADIEGELTSDIVGKYLTTDYDFIKYLAANHRNIFQKIYDEIKYLCKLATAGSKEARQLETLKHLFEKAYRESGNAQKNTTENGGVKYSIAFDSQGYFVKIDTNKELFDGKTIEEMQEIARKFIRDNFRGKVLEVGKKGKAYVNKRSGEEYSHPANRRMPQDIKESKMRASTELDNLLKVSEFIKNTTDDGRHPDATGGWDLYSTRFEISGQMFDGVVKIKVTDRGYVFYDISQIKRIARKGGLTENNSVAATGNPSIDIIDDIAPTVNSNSMQESEKNSFSAEYADMDTESVRPTFREPSSREIHREPTQEEEYAAIIGQRKEAKQRHITDIAKKLDPKLTLVWVEKGSDVLKGKNGKFVRDKNIMYIAKDIAVAEMYVEVFKHEFVHRLESRGAYIALKDYLIKHSTAFEAYVRGQLRLKDGKAFSGSREEVIKAYTQYCSEKYGLNQEFTEREIVADFVGDVIFKGKDKIKDIAQGLADEDLLSIGNIETDMSALEELANTDRNLLQRIIDAIRDLINKIPAIAQNKTLIEDLEYIEKRLAKVYDSADTKKAASKAANVQFSFNDNNNSESKFIIDTINENVNSISEKNIFSVKGEQIPEGIKKTEYVLNIFEEQGKIADNKEIGIVELVQSGAKSTVFHGFGADKLAATKAIKTVIEKGNIIKVTKNYNNTGVDRYVMAAKGTIDGKSAFVGLIIRAYPNQRNQNAKFYLHEATIIETDSPIMTAPQLSVDTVSESVTNDIIDEKPSDVKDIISEENEIYSETDRIYEAIGVQRFTAEQRKIVKIGKKLGYGIVFRKMAAENGVIKDGEIDKVNKIIYINTEAKKPIQFIIKHELTHFLEISKDKYKALVKNIMDSKVFESWLKSKGYASIDEYRTAIIEQYSKIDEAFGPEDADLEIVANFVGENLFGNEGQIKRLAEGLNPKQRPKLVQMIIDFIAHLREKLGIDSGIDSELKLLEKEYKKLLKEVIAETKNQNPDTVLYKNRYTLAAVENASLVELAESYRKAGWKPERIWKKLHMVRATDGVWLYEISDSGYVFAPLGDALTKDRAKFERYMYLDSLEERTKAQEDEYTALIEELYGGQEQRYYLMNYLIHPELFARYPQLKTACITFEDLSRQGYKGYYNSEKNRIVIDIRLKPKGKWNRSLELNKTLMHEIQHALQEYDKRAHTAGDSKYFKQLFEGSGVSVIDFCYEYWIPKMFLKLNNKQKKLYKSWVAIIETYNDRIKEVNQRVLKDDGILSLLERCDIIDEINSELEKFKSDEDVYYIAKIDMYVLCEEKDKLYFELYASLRHELEAREAARRRDMTDAEREAQMPNLGGVRALTTEEIYRYVVNNYGKQRSGAAVAGISGEANSHEPTVTGARGEYYLSSGEDGDAAADKSFSDSLPESAENNPDIDKYGYKQDNISRANEQGELINDYYYALSKNEWRMFYDKITNNGYLATANTGVVAPVVVNDKLIVAERLYTGKDAHDYTVLDAFQLEEAYDGGEALDLLAKKIEEGELIYDRQTMYQNLSRLLSRNQSAGVLTRFDADSQRYVRGDAQGINGTGNEGIYTDSQKGIAGEGLSLRDKSSIQEDDELLDEPSPFNESEAVDKFKHGGVNSYEPTVTGARGEYYLSVDEDGDVAADKSFSDSLPESAENNPDIDKYGYKQDNISRANEQGELINDYYYALSKNEWRMFYDKITNNGYLATANTGVVAPVVVNDKLIVAERLYTGKDAHDYVVTDTYKLFSEDGDTYTLTLLQDALNKGDIDYDSQRIFSFVNRLNRLDGRNELLTRYNRDNSRFYATFDNGKQEKSISEIHTDSQERLAGEGLSLRDKSSVQENDELLDEPSPFNESEAVDKFEQGGVNSYEPTVTGARGEYYLSSGEELEANIQRKINEQQTINRGFSENHDLLYDTEKASVEGYRKVTTKTTSMANKGDIQWNPKGDNISLEQYKELRDYAQSKGIVLRGFKNSDVDVSLIKEFIDDAAKILQDYPEIIKDSKKPLTFQLDYHMNNDDFAGISEGTTHIIKLNGVAMRNKEKLAEEYLKLSEEGFFVKGTNYHSVISHEMGHIIGDIKKVDSFNTLKDIIGLSTETEILDWCAENLSEYSSKFRNGVEIISEAFSAYRSNKANETILTLLRKYNII